MSEALTNRAIRASTGVHGFRIRFNWRLALVAAAYLGAIAAGTHFLMGVMR